MDPIRVLIADDHPTLRRGLKSLLALYPDIMVVGEADGGPTTLSAVADLTPDVILLDILMPGADGVEVAQRLRREAPQAKIIMLTAYDNDEYVLGAMRAGAWGYVLKSTSDQTLVESIRQVHQGKRLLSPPLMDKVLHEFQSLANVRARQESGLSERDLKVVELMAQGKTNKDIAQEMFWSDRTIKRKVEDMMTKLGARNRAQLVAEATKRGLL
jgi:two-component system, NarL family, response regulator DevR